MASRRVRIFVIVAAVIAAVVIGLTLTVAIAVFRSMVAEPAAPAAAAASFDSIRRMFPGREPLVAIGDLRKAQFRINRAPDAPRQQVDTLKFMTWDPEDQKLVRGEVPAWVAWLRVSPLGIGNLKFSDLHVTLEDIERYAPGVIVDFKTADGEQILVWVQ